MNPIKITVSGGNLFQLASAHCGSALLWYQIAQINGLPADPMISLAAGAPPLVLTLPPPDPTGGNGGLLYQ